MPQRNYIDFKLYLTKPESLQGGCQVALLPTPEVGETISPVVVPVSSLPNPDLLALLAGKMIPLPQLIELGKQLADCMLPKGQIRELFLNAYRQVGPEEGIRLRLIFANHALKELPWEYVYLNLIDETASLSGFLVLDPRISLVRHEPLPYPHPVIASSQADIKDLRMLILAAQPEGTPSLELDVEVNNIQKAIRDFNVEGLRFSVNTLMDATPSDLMQAASIPGSAYILHFAGHGTTEVKRDWLNQGAERQVGYLLLLSDKMTCAEERISAEDFARLLAGAGVRLAVIGACHSGTRDARYPWDSIAGALTARLIPAVIAMQYDVIDQHAVDFSKMFYYALASGLSLDEAVSLGRQAMFRIGSSADQVDLEWGVPVLYSRLSDGAIFPERMARAGDAAKELRMVVEQTVKDIHSTGKVTGISLEHLEGGIYQVKQRVDTVAGRLVGIEVQGGTGVINVDQGLGSVSGDVTGVILK